MLFGPIKALYSVKYYLENLQKSAWKAVLFVLYLFVISSVVVVISTSITGTPIVKNIIEKVAQYTPDIDVKNGRVTVNNDEPLTIEPKELGGLNIVFDTDRTEPVYPSEMAKDKTIFLVTGDTTYFNFQDQFQVTPIPDDFNMLITPQMIMANSPAIANIMLSTIITVIVIAQFIKIPFMLLLAFLTAALINSLLKTNVRPGRLLKLAFYLQAPATVLFILTYLSPVKIPFVVVIYVLIFATYARLVLSKLAPVQTELEQDTKEETEEDDTEDKKEI